MPSVRSVSVVFVKSNWMRLQLVLPWFTPRDSRGGLQTETKSLGYCHLPSYDLAEDALKRDFLRCRAKFVPLGGFFLFAVRAICGAWSRSGRLHFAPYHNLALCAQHLHTPVVSTTQERPLASRLW